MEQYTENQYDDDLTDSSAEYDDSYYTGAEDLFDYTPDEESPISRLKSLVLSIDWEITDDVLMEFNEELVDLKDVWAGEKINLVYVQALEKLSKYIYQKKAESHPSAIKLLLTLYHNLEKIVTSDDLSESEKKSILLEDVKRFENLKSHLRTPVSKTADAIPQPVMEEITPAEEADGDSELINLKAIVLGIDWEITDDDLSALKKEVIRLENLFAESRPKLILLQGIGTIGAYIKVKKSDSHADAFKVLHLFYNSLEKMVDSPMSVDEEKAVLFPAIEKFNEFKALLGETISPEKINQSADSVENSAPEQQSGAITPAFSDLAENDIQGFQADEEAAALGIDNPDKVNDHVANFFGEDSFVDERQPNQQLSDKLEAQFSEEVDSEIESVDKNVALQGVDVEEGDEEGDEGAQEVASLADAEEVDVAPALSFDDESAVESPATDVKDEISATDFLTEEEPASSVDEKIEVTFPDDGEEEVVADFSSIDKKVALQGVDVESEADDDSDEDALPVVEGELAPALVGNDEVSLFNEGNLEKTQVSDGLQDEVADTVLDFFEEESRDNQVVDEPVEEKVETPLALDEDLSIEREFDTPSSKTIEEHAVEVLESDLEKDLDEFNVAEEVATVDEVQEIKEENVTTDIEGQLDDFFGSDDFVDEDNTEDVFSSMEFAGDEDQHVAAVAEKIVEEPEEVVFELVDDIEPSHTLGGAQDLAINEVAAIASLSGDTTSKTSLKENVSELAHLEACIHAVGVELEDKVLTGLVNEIESLDENWAHTSYKKTFVHLLRTVTLYIDRYRYEAGSDAYDVLQSIYSALKGQSSSEENGELLFAETVRVLDWQQAIIAKDSVKGAENGRMSESLFVQELGNTGQNSVASENKTDGGDEGPANLKDEITSLRKSLQDEISELKKGQK